MEQEFTEITEAWIGLNLKIRCTVIKVPHPKKEGGPVLLLQNYPHPLSLTRPLTRVFLALW